MNQQELVQQLSQLHMAQEEQIFVGENKEPMNDWKAIRNVDTKQVVSIVSKEYQLIQHREIANAFVDACKGLNLDFEIKVFENRNRMFVNAEFPQTKIDVKVGEEFVQGFRLINSYDKSTGIVIVPRLVRLSCLNGMVMASGRYVPVFHYKHTQKMAESFETYMVRAIAQMAEMSDSFKNLIESCMEDSIEWDMAKRLIEYLAPTQKHIVGIQNKLDPSKPITRWDLYNAITNYCTHGERLLPNVENWLQARAERVLETPLQRLMVEVPPAAAKKE